MNIFRKTHYHAFIRRVYIFAVCRYEECCEYLLLQRYYLLASFKKEKRKVILCYPKKPLYYHSMYQMCRFNHFIITDIPGQADAVFNFEDTTFRADDAVLRKLSKHHTVVNYRCRDISKETVDALHKKIFGYNLSIDPRIYKGSYVKKSNRNSIHRSVVLDHPEEPEKGYVYQRLVNNKKNDELIEIRLPVMGRILPFAYMKLRSEAYRFQNLNKRVYRVPVDQVISPQEQKQILQFCHALGFDYGELDVLRDTKTSTLYIIDANTTPAGLPYQFPFREYKQTMRLLSEAFIQSFLS